MPKGYAIYCRRHVQGSVIENLLPSVVGMQEPRLQLKQYASLPASQHEATLLNCAVLCGGRPITRDPTRDDFGDRYAQPASQSSQGLRSASPLMPWGEHGQPRGRPSTDRIDWKLRGCCQVPLSKMEAGQKGLPAPGKGAAALKETKRGTLQRQGSEHKTCPFF